MKINPKLLIYIGITVVILIVIYLVLKRVGLIKTRVEKQAIAEKKKINTDRKIIQTLVSRSDYFKPSFYKNRPIGELISEGEAKKYAEQIEDSWGLLNDDEEQIFDAFRALTSKAQVSQVADQYSKEFKADLAGELIDKLGKKELQIVYDITDNLR